jgi:energy-coupling factor transporter ATP-binding protein EcfA2
VKSEALVITGAPGSGKSTVLGMVGTLLEIDGIAFAAVECDELARGWPYPPLPEVLARLAAVTALQRQAGRSLTLVVATTETDGELEQVIEAIGAERTLVVCLRAPADVVAGRVGAREPDAWPGKQHLVAHACVLALQIPDLGRIDAVIDSSAQLPATVAGEVHGLLRGWTRR